MVSGLRDLTAAGGQDRQIDVSLAALLCTGAGSIPVSLLPLPGACGVREGGGRPPGPRVGLLGLRRAHHTPERQEP